MPRRLVKLAATIAVGLGVIGANLAAYRYFAYPTEEFIAGVQRFSNLPRTHTTAPVTYAQTPPVGGPHDPVFLNCGIYLHPVRAENAVRSLENGAVWITYRPGLAAGQMATLRRMVLGKSYLILSPYPHLLAPVVASAWGRQLRLRTAHDPRLAMFISVYREGPQTPERGAPCSDGTGTPWLGQPSVKTR